MRSWPVFGALLALACGSQSAATSPATAPKAASDARIAAAGPSSSPAHDVWLTTLDRDNALVGRIWDAKAGTFVEPRVMFGRLAATRFVLLGERHDNPDHHRLQARALSELVKAGRRPAVVFEML